MHSSPHHFLLGSTGILPLTFQAAWNPPRDSRTAQETWCLIWHHKFLSGARHWMLTVGTAKSPTLMNRALRSFQLWGALKIGSCVITALSVHERFHKNATAAPSYESLNKYIFTDVQSHQSWNIPAFVSFYRDLPERFVWSCLWLCQCRFGLEGARKTAWERKPWSCQA